jgi:hypothetical protein
MPNSTVSFGSTGQSIVMVTVASPTLSSAPVGPEY